MTPLAVLICVAIVLSTGLGVYLRLRQLSRVTLNRGRVPDDFAKEVSLEEHRRAADYTVAKTRFSIATTVFDGILSLAWLLLWLPPFYWDVSRIVEPGLTRSVALMVVFGLIAGVLELPFELAETFWLEARFGFNRQSVGAFFGDRLKTGALEILVATPLLYGMFALLRAAPDYWWLYAFAGFIVFIVAMMAIYPTFIAPLFNKFAPLPDEAMRRRSRKPPAELRI